MKRLPLILLALIGGAIAGQHLLVQGGGSRIDFRTIRRRMMERMLNSMPEHSLPKLVMSILPRLKEQNDQILALLKEQNELLRQRVARH